jgi:hypothetical protein
MPRCPYAGPQATNKLYENVEKFKKREIANIRTLIRRKLG